MPPHGPAAHAVRSIRARARVAKAARIGVALLALALLTGPTYGESAAMVTHLPATTYTSDTTWTVANSPYVLDGDVTVAAGATLTIEPGVIVKLNGQLRSLWVNGVLKALGSSSNSIVFTSYQDDSAGGDTNGDGAATSGAAGQWSAIKVGSSNADTELKFVTVRYGGWGSAEWNYGALEVSSTATVTVEDSTLSNNQQSAIKVGTGSSSSWPGVVVRRSTIANNANGISANQGWMRVEESTVVRDNSKDGLWFNLTTSYGGATSRVLDSEVRNNSQRGLYLQIDTGLAASYWPWGTRNNIYANTQKQLDSLNVKRTVEWKHNYWGDAAYHRFSPSACINGGIGAQGYLAYRTSGANPPDGPVARSSYTILSPSFMTCYYDKVLIGPVELSPFRLRATPGMAPGQSFGCQRAGELAIDASGCMQDPVDSATGSFTHEVTDLSLPGVGLPFAFTRTYNSLDPTTGPLGVGWTHSYNASLTIMATGDVVARAGSGQQLQFVRNADGSFTAAAGGRASLTTVQGGYELTTFDQRRYRFDTAGKLTSLLDRNSQGLTFAYDGNGRLSTIIDSASRTITLTYNAEGLISQLAVPDGRTVTYAYTYGRLTSVTDVRGKVWTYVYEGQGFGLLEKEVDPLNHTVFRNIYGSDGRVVEQYDALNNKTTFSWDWQTQTQTATDARNNVWKHVYSNNILQKDIDALNNETQFISDSGLNQTSVTGPTAQTTSMSYDSRGNLLTATAPASLGSVQKTFVYNANNDVTQVTDARGKVTTYGYDANGNNTSVVQDGQTVATNAYNALGQLTSSTDGANRTITYTYDASGNLTSETDALGNKTTYGYDAAGRKTSMVEPRGNVQGADPNLCRTTYTYDAAGNLLTETNPLGHVTTYAYDNAGNRASVTDANNKTTAYTYDAANHVLTETAPDTGVTTYTYDAVGNKLTERNANNHTTTNTYDANNRLASVTSPLGNKTTYGYDANGNLTSEVEPRGNVQGANPNDYKTTYTYDAAGRLLTETDPLGNVTTYTYDAVGNRTSVRDANNHTTSYAYDGRNRLQSVTAPSGAATTYAYDAAGNLLSVTDANSHVTSYVYDAANRVTSRTLPLNRVWTYGYDAAGNPTQTVDANGNATETAGDGTTTNSYDRAGRLTGIDYSGSTPDVTFSYDPAGNRTQVSDGAGTKTYTYDAVNRLKTVTRGADVFAYDYDLAGNLTRRTYPDGTTTDYTYDADSRLASAASSGQTTTYAYDAAGNPTETTLPAGNGHVEERTYDRAGRLTRVESVKDAATLVDFTYTLDPVGNPTQIVRTGSAPGTTTHAYDVRDRLTEVCFQTSCPGGSDPFVRWTYDAVGNRLTEARPAGTTNYTYNDADQLTQAGSTTYSYDQNGNETAAGSRTFASDVANRVISTTSGGTTTYTYDGDGNRLQITSGGQTTRLLWDENHSLPQLALERDGGGALLRRYVYGDRRVSMTTAGAAFYYHHDGLGSVANITASNGAPQWSYAYEPFGAARTATQDDPSAPTNPLKFAGELEDATNLYYLRARQYDPVSGRFLQVDPVSVDETAPAISTYSYVANRPTVLVDPSGKTGQASDVAPAKADGVVSPVIEGPVLGARSRCGTELGAAILRHRNIFIYSPHRSGVISDLCTRGVINWKVKRGLLRAAGYFKLGIYVMKTGHSPGTYHELGRAVDLANFTSSNMALATRFMRWLNTNRKMLANFVELIGPNESLVYPQGGYSRATLNGHKNHVHIAW